MTLPVLPVFTFPDVGKLSRHRIPDVRPGRVDVVLVHDVEAMPGPLALSDSIASLGVELLNVRPRVRAPACSNYERLAESKGMRGAFLGSELWRTNCKDSLAQSE